jgi:hypothetical protein
LVLLFSHGRRGYHAVRVITLVDGLGQLRGQSELVLNRLGQGRPFNGLVSGRQEYMTG